MNLHLSRVISDRAQICPDTVSSPNHPPSSLSTAWLRAYAQLLSVKWNRDTRAGDIQEGCRDNLTSDWSQVLGHPAAMQSQTFSPCPHDDKPILPLLSSPSVVALKQKVVTVSHMSSAGEINAIKLNWTWNHRWKWPKKSIAPISSDTLKGKAT